MVEEEDDNSDSLLADSTDANGLRELNQDK